jgi:hypothetical protein
MWRLPLETVSMLKLDPTLSSKRVMQRSAALFLLAVVLPVLVALLL